MLTKRVIPCLDVTQGRVVKGTSFTGLRDAGNPVELAAFWVQAEGQSLVVYWETVQEVDTLGFNLYRAESEDGPRTKLNDTLIPAQAPGSPIGASYTWADEGVETGVTYYYWLEDVDIHGFSTLHGPVSGALEGNLYQIYLPLVVRASTD